MGSRRRVLISVEPAVLGGALAEVVDATGGDDEVVVIPAGQPVSGRFDAAIVMEHGTPVEAEVVIELTEGPGDAVVVRRASSSAVIDLRHAGGIVHLVEQELGPGD